MFSFRKRQCEASAVFGNRKLDSMITTPLQCNCNYTLFTKSPWPGDSEGTFRSLSLSTGQINFVNEDLITLIEFILNELITTSPLPLQSSLNLLHLRTLLVGCSTPCLPNDLPRIAGQLPPFYRYQLTP